LPSVATSAGAAPASHLKTHTTYNSCNTNFSILLKHGPHLKRFGPQDFAHIFIQVGDIGPILLRQLRDLPRQRSATCYYDSSETGEKRSRLFAAMW
jgi:hypothetical protein